MKLSDDNAPVIFTLNNTGIHQIYISVALTTVFALDAIADASLRRYYEQSGMERALAVRLYKEIVEGAPSQYPLRAFELAALYRCIDFVAKALIAPQLEPWLRHFFGEDEEGFILLRNKYMSFASVALQKFAHDFASVEDMWRVKQITDHLLV